MFGTKKEVVLGGELVKNWGKKQKTYPKNNINKIVLSRTKLSKAVSGKGAIPRAKGSMEVYGKICCSTPTMSHLGYSAVLLRPTVTS